MYNLGPLSAAEQAALQALQNGYCFSADTAYTSGTNWVVADDYHDWWLIRYDSGTGGVTALYVAGSSSLDGAYWVQWGDNTNWPPPTTLCAQDPLCLPFSVAAGTVTNIALPWWQAMLSLSPAVQTNSLQVAASQPVSVYAANYEWAASAAFTAYPTPFLGTNYCLLSRPAAIASQTLPPYSELAILATADNTTVTITPSPTANLGYSGVYTQVLQQGWAYQVSSLTYTDDVTGTWVTSDKPVAVFAGAYLAYVTTNEAGNPLVQEQLPVCQWGTQALALSFGGRTGGDTYRVLGVNSDTVVTTNGVIVGTNQLFDLLIDGPVEFKASQPIQVAHFANGVKFDNPPFDYGDPCEILLPPAGHYLTTNIVFTLTNDLVTGDFPVNWLNIIVTRLAITNTLVDGVPLTTNDFVAIGTSGYYGTRYSLTNSGPHTVAGSQPVGVEVYGFGETDAYGYFGGTVK